MVSQYTVGEVLPLYYVAESSFGVTPTSALAFGADIATGGNFRSKVSKAKLFNYQAGSQIYQSTNKQAMKAGFSARLWNRSAVDWRTFFATYAIGSTTAFADHPGSFSLLMGKVRSGSYLYNKYNGCKISKLTIGSDLAGTPFYFDVDVIAQWIDWSASKTFSRIQSVTMGANPTDPAKPVDAWTGVMQININAGGLVNFKPRSFSLTVDRHMEGQPGNVLGADGSYYSLQAGEGINEGNAELIFDFTVATTGDTYTNSKLADDPITALTIPVGSRTITLTGGEWQGDDLPELKQALNEETGRILFKGIRIA